MTDEIKKIKIILGDPEKEDNETLEKLSNSVQEHLEMIDLKGQVRRGTPKPGDRGDPLVIGEILVNLGGVAVGSLITLLGKWMLDRNHFRVIMKDTTDDGKEIKLERDKVKTKDLEKVTNEMEEWFENRG